MKPIDGYLLIKPEDLKWQPAKPMQIPYADLLEPGERLDLKRFWPVDPKQLPKELEGSIWPPKTTARKPL